jgi:hypothetical protein
VINVPNKGGHPVDEFVYSHFTTVGEKTWKKQPRNNGICNANTARTLQNSSCTEIHAASHILPKQEKVFAQMHYAPPEVRAEAQRRLMAKGGLEIPESTSDVEISEVGTSSTASKKAKVSETGVLTRS